MRSFRTRVLLLVLLVALPPLALTGVWLTHAVVASGDRILRGRLRDLAERTAAETVQDWADVRYHLLFIAEDKAIQRALASGSTLAPDARARLEQLFAPADTMVGHVRVRDAEGTVVWDDGSTDASIGPVFRLPVYRIGDGRRIGTLDATMRPRFFARLDPATNVLGASIAVLDPATGHALLPTAFDVPDLGRDHFEWAGDEWLTERRTVSEPRMELVVAAPRTPYVSSLRTATRQGTFLLLLLGLAGGVVAWIWSKRLTRGLRDVATAAAAVASGELDRQVTYPGRDELRTVADAFNRMTQSLGRTVGELADREALAAVGQFSAELAHEVRNPLSAIRLDLRYVEERLPTDSPLREAQAAALAGIEQVDATVSSTLLLSRSGSIEFTPTLLGAPLRAACRAARPAFQGRDATLDEGTLDLVDTRILGDPVALERLFLNLLLNAAESSDAGGRAAVLVEEGEDSVCVTVEDDGYGIPDEVRERIFDARYTSKSGGSGFGLAIARRIAQAHRGAIYVESEPGRGTRVRVTLPRAGGVTEAGEMHRAVTGPTGTTLAGSKRK